MLTITLLSCWSLTYMGEALHFYLCASPPPFGISKPTCHRSAGSGAAGVRYRFRRVPRPSPSAPLRPARLARKKPSRSVLCCRNRRKPASLRNTAGMDSAPRAIAVHRCFSYNIEAAVFIIASLRLKVGWLRWRLRCPLRHRTAHRTPRAAPVGRVPSRPRQLRARASVSVVLLLVCISILMPIPPPRLFLAPKKKVAKNVERVDIFCIFAYESRG